MRYRLDLPLEEQQRLDQIHLNQGGVSPYRNGLNNENSGLNSMFPPKTSLIPPSQWINKTTGKPWEKSGRGDMPPGYKAGPTDAPIPWADDPRLAEFEHRPEMIRPVYEPPAPPSPPTTGGFSQLPTTMPRPFGGGGKGGNFLGRFERLLDGLEGLVGKLGGSGGTSESPFPTGDGGGLSEVIQTPFTPTQDY